MVGDIENEMDFKRFVATSGFTPDVKVWEVKFSRSGDFEKAARAFDLTGGNQEKKLRGSNIPLRSSEWSVQLCLQCRQWENGNGEQILVFTFAFVLCMVKVSKDGSWKVFNTAIEFSRGQDAEVLVTGSYPWDSNQPSQISLSPDGLVVAIAQVGYLNHSKIPAVPVQ